MAETRSRRPRRRFTDEFKQQAVRLVLDEGKSVTAVARELDRVPSASPVGKARAGGPHEGPHRPDDSRARGAHPAPAGKPDPPGRARHLKKGPSTTSSARNPDSPSQSTGEYAAEDPQASLLRPVDALKEAKAASGTGRIDARAVLVTTQIALTLILLAGAGLMIRSAEQLRETGIGVDPAGLFTVHIDLPGAAYDNDRGQQLYAQLLERVGALPGVRSAALGLCAPVSGGCNSTIAVSVR